MMLNNYTNIVTLFDGNYQMKIKTRRYTFTGLILDIRVLNKKMCELRDNTCYLVTKEHLGLVVGLHPSLVQCQVGRRWLYEVKYFLPLYAKK